MKSQVEGAFLIPQVPFRPSYISQVSKDKVMTDLHSFRINGAPTNEDARAETELLFGAGNGFDTPKPEGWLERLILAGSPAGGVVLDPFAGSGTTLAVAQKLGRSWAGVELRRGNAEKFIIPRLHGVVSGVDPLPVLEGAAPGGAQQAGFAVIEVETSNGAVA